MPDNNLFSTSSNNNTSCTNNPPRKHASIKSQSEVSYSQRKNHRIDLQKQAHKQKRNELLEQLKRRKVSDNEDGQGGDYIYNIGVFSNVLNSQESSVSQKINAMKQSRIILSKCDPDTLTNILDQNGQFVNLLHQYLVCKYSELQLESAWCITNIAAMKDDSVAFCIPTLVQLISNSFLDVVLQEQCIWALGNISLGFYNNTPLSTVIIQNGAIPYLCNAIRACRVNEILKTTLWCVSNIIRNEILHMKQNTPEHNQQLFGCLGQLYEPTVYVLLKRKLSDDGTISDLLYVLSYLTAYPLTDSGNSTNFAQIFIKYLTPQKQVFITPIIRIIGNVFCSYNLFSTLDQNLSLELMNLLSNIPDKNKEWCYMMGNISSYEDINEILIQQYHLLNITIDTLKSAINSDISNNSELVRETVFTIINLTTANHNKYLSKEIIELIKQVAQSYTFDENENNQQFKIVLTQFFDMEQHILIDGKINYELDELCSNLALHHEQYKEGITKIRRWEDAKFLKDQNFKVPEKPLLVELEHEELQFECESDILPNYAIPSSSSRRDLEIILNQILSIIRSDHEFKEWVIEQTLSFTSKNFKSLLIDNFLEIIQNLFEIFVKKTKSNHDNLFIDNRVQESIWKTVLFDMKENYQGDGALIDMALIFLYLRTKEYEKAEICLLNIVSFLEKLESKLILNYFHLLLGHVLRINFKLDSCACYFRKLVNGLPFGKSNNMILYSAIYMWLGEVMESMDLDVWAVESYLKCSKYFSEHPNMNHPFVTISFVFIKLAELFFKDYKENGNNMHLAKIFYQKAFIGFERNNLLQNKTFIELSPYTINYNKASIAIRLGCIIYLEKDFNKSLEFFLQAEESLLKIRFDQSQRKSDGSALNILQTLHRKIAINYCRLGLFQNASKYVTYRIIVDNSNISETDYQKQLNLILEEKEREKRERKAHAKHVIAQEHPSCFLSLSLISFHKNSISELCKYCELIFKTSELEKEIYLPLLTFQKLVSLLISSQQLELAQIICSKYLITSKSYSLGYYILFLLSIKNQDNNSIIGCWKKFNETYQANPFEPMSVYWPFILSSTLRLPMPKL